MKPAQATAVPAHKNSKQHASLEPLRKPAGLFRHPKQRDVGECEDETATMPNLIPKHGTGGINTEKAAEKRKVIYKG